MPASFDFSALLTEMEFSVVRNILRKETVRLTPESREMLMAMLGIFKRHGVRAMEAIDILAEMGTVCKEIQDKYKEGSNHDA